MNPILERVRFWAIIAALAATGWRVFFHEAERSRPPGVLCPADPKQGKSVERPTEPRWVKAGWGVWPIAPYSIRARVLSTRRYRYDACAKLAPVDLALGWGRMSDSATLDALTISQRWRWYDFSYRRAPIPQSEIELCSANTHVIPAGDAVRDTVLDAIRGDVVRLDGWLVSCEPLSGGGAWTSSTTRTDTGGGACEIMWVERAEIEK